MRNFKLLLATTAILSTTMAMNVNADSVPPSTYTNAPRAILKAGIDIFSPITMDSQYGKLDFPSITTTPVAGANSVKVTLNYDGTIDYESSNATIINASYAEVKPILISSGNISKLFQTEYTEAGANVTELDNAYNNNGMFNQFDVDVAESIPMLDENSAPCGTVTNLTRRWHYNSELNSNTGGIELRFGGTFELYKDGNTYYTPTDGYAYCKGETTVTLFMDF